MSNIPFSALQHENAPDIIALFGMSYRADALRETLAELLDLPNVSDAALARTAGWLTQTIAGVRELLDGPLLEEFDRMSLAVPTLDTASPLACDEQFVIAAMLAKFLDRVLNEPALRLQFGSAQSDDIAPATMPTRAGTYL